MTSILQRALRITHHLPALPATSALARDHLASAPTPHATATPAAAAASTPANAAAAGAPAPPGPSAKAPAANPAPAAAAPSITATLERPAITCRDLLSALEVRARGALSVLGAALHRMVRKNMAAAALPEAGGFCAGGLAAACLKRQRPAPCPPHQVVRVWPVHGCGGAAVQRGGGSAF